MVSRIQHFGELVRFSHTLFALPFALLASAWAWIVPPSLEGTSVSFRWLDLLGILLCMVAARSFAMAMNRLVDERFDAANPRTAIRHLPAKLMSRNEVLGFGLAAGLVFVAATALFLPNPLPLILSLPVLAVLLGYSYGKRFTWLVHFWLGIALMLAPICAWIAIRGTQVMGHPADLLPAVGLGILVLLWVSGFDIIYACQDFQFDRQAGLHSVPARFGIRGALGIAKSLHFAMFLTAIGLTFAFPQLSLGWIFRVAVIAVGVLLWLEHSVVSETRMDRMQLAFFQLNVTISLVLLVAGSLDAYLR